MDRILCFSKIPGRLILNQLVNPSVCTAWSKGNVKQFSCPYFPDWLHLAKVQPYSHYPSNWKIAILRLSNPEEVLRNCCYPVWVTLYFLYWFTCWYHEYLKNIVDILSANIDIYPPEWNENSRNIPKPRW